MPVKANVLVKGVPMFIRVMGVIPVMEVTLAMEVIPARGVMLAMEAKLLRGATLAMGVILAKGILVDFKGDVFRLMV